MPSNRDAQFGLPGGEGHPRGSRPSPGPNVTGRARLPSVRAAIGLDVGGTKIAGGLVAAADGQVLGKIIIPTEPTRGGAAVLDDTVALARTLMRQAEDDNVRISGIGIGICELVDPDGNITSRETVDWQDLAVADAFAGLTASGGSSTVSVVVESDVRAHALAEARYGAGRAFANFAYVTVGTGISYTLVQDGRPYAGARGNALVLASMPWSTICDQCGAESNQVLEAYASGPALVSRFNQARGLGGAGTGTTGSAALRAEEVLAAVAAGDEAAKEIVRTAGAALGNAIGFMVNLLDPEAVIIGGGLGLAGGLYWDACVASTREHIYAGSTRALPILPAALGVDAGMIGAAAAALVQQETEQKAKRGLCGECTGE